MGASIYLGKSLSAGTKGCNIVLASIAPSLLLDTYTGAAVAYSLRQLRTAYTGAAIRVRRSSDNAEQDINFVGGDLDTTSMINFVGQNLWTYSEEWDQIVWFKSQLNTTGTPSYIDVETAPDSTLTADKIIENTISSTHLTSRQLLVTSGITYYVSIYLKSGGRDAKVTSAISSLATYEVDVDLTNGTLSNNTFPITPLLESVGNGWYRLKFQVTAANTQTRTVMSIITMNGTSTNYLGDGTSGVYVWGAQVNNNGQYMPYYKTEATANNGDAYITTWYDQSGNANDATQATAASQAQIVSSGAVITDPNTGKISSTWTSDRYTLTTGISPNTQYLSIGVVNRTTNTGGINQLGRSSAIGGINGQQPLFWFATTGNLRSDMSTGLVHGTNTSTGVFIMTSEKNASNLKTAYLNGSALVTTATEAPSAGSNLDVFGQAGSNYTFGRYAEYIYWDSEQSANRTAIEDNINTYWNAY